MLMMVTGGSGSGKSEFAESLVTGLADGPNLYIATMFPLTRNAISGLQGTGKCGKIRDLIHWSVTQG